MQGQNILFQKGKKIYFLEDFELEVNKLKTRKIIPLENFVVKNKNHRNLLVKETFKYSLKLIEEIGLDLKKNYNLNIRQKDLVRFLLPWASRYVILFYSIYKRSINLKKKKFNLVKQKNSFYNTKINFSSYHSFDVFYEAWKDIYHFSKKKINKENVLFFKAYNDEYTLSNIFKYCLSQISIFIGKVLNKKIILNDSIFGQNNMLKLMLKSRFKFCYFFPKINKYKDLKITNYQLNTKYKKDQFLLILLNYYKKYIFSNYMNILFSSKKTNVNDIILTEKLNAKLPSYRNYFLSNPKVQIYAIQHGGGYNIDENCLVEIIEKKICKKFIYWGKSKKKEKISTPPIKKSSKSNDNIFYVTTAVQRSLAQIDDPFFPQHAKNIYYKNQYNILRILSEHKLKTILRLDKNDKRNYNSFVQSNIKFKNIYFDEGKLNFSKNLKESSLILVDYLGTTYLQSLSMNKPTIIFCNKKFFYTKKKSLKFFKDFKKVSIFFDDIKKLNKFLKKKNNHEKIIKWWNGKKLQLAVKKFNHEFLNPSRTWDEELIKKFK